MEPTIGILPTASLYDQRELNDLRSHYVASTPERQILRSKKAEDVVVDYSRDAAGLIRPNIQFQPSLEDYLERSQQVRMAGLPATDLPRGFPQEIIGSRVWSGQDGTSVEQFIVQLSSQDIIEIESAVAGFKSLPGDNGPEHVSKDLFPLPTLGIKLRTVSEELHNGRGVAILGGLDPKKYTSLENVLIFAGVTSYIGGLRGCQDSNGNVLTHLQDMAYKFGSDSKRTPVFTANALPYHSDVCDILALYVQECASGGGESSLSSSGAVYNEIAATRPDVIKTLTDAIWVYDRDETPAEWPTRSLLFTEAKHGPFFCFSRQKITGSEFLPLSPTIPAMTEAQAEALDMIHFTAEKHGLKIDQKCGDILLYNNLAIFHGREAFTSSAMGENRRHVLRLWLRNEEMAWQTPPGLTQDWFRVFGDSERQGRAHWTIRPEDTGKERVIGHKMTCG